LHLVLAHHVNAGVRSFGHHELDLDRTVAVLGFGVDVDAAAGGVDQFAAAVLEDNLARVGLVEGGDANLPLTLLRVALQLPAAELLAVEGRFREDERGTHQRRAECDDAREIHGATPSCE
jgi:hypothetical protein